MKLWCRRRLLIVTDWTSSRFSKETSTYSISLARMFVLEFRMCVVSVVVSMISSCINRLDSISLSCVMLFQGHVATINSALWHPTQRDQLITCSDDRLDKCGLTMAMMVQLNCASSVTNMLHRLLHDVCLICRSISNCGYSISL